ncbi:unnamed protein product [Schistocephalus solidus]|uniref:Uncharacterized protein n=1 Tax=Schistocephalus solidus TaxID=70667 RepID=A0A183T2K7_SCHSO|nr:unnamed protein product [Schistocephalus solidus]
MEHTVDIVGLRRSNCRDRVAVTRIKHPFLQLSLIMCSRANPKRQTNKHHVPVIASELLPGTRLFTYISNLFGRDALRSARRWETFALRESSTSVSAPVSCKPSVNTELARRAVFQHGSRMIRVLLQDCHLRLHKYRPRIDEERTRYCEFYTTAITDGGWTNP